jgi:hypothetical protein
MKMKLILFLIFSSLTFASSFSINDRISTFSLPDQFDKMHTINSSTSTIIVSFELHMSKKVHKFLAKKDADFLSKNHTVFISNISSNPSIVTKMFILPKMRDYKYPILLIYDENNKKFIERDDKLTIYKLKDGVIKSVGYATTTAEIEKFF